MDLRCLFSANLMIGEHVVYFGLCLLAKSHAYFAALTPHLINANDVIAIWADQNTYHISLTKWSAILDTTIIVNRPEDWPKEQEACEVTEQQSSDDDTDK